jgi:hypothetical protein
MQYAKYIDNLTIDFPPKNKDKILNYDINYEKLIEDGYKEYIEAEPPSSTNRHFHYEYEETDNNILQVIAYDETQEEADARDLKNTKEYKIIENDSTRNEALNQGVTYNNVLFDSDTDQKANLLGAVLQMSDTNTIEWYGMNNDSLVCTKQDLLNIGALITQLHSFCWTRNAEIKQAISEAQTIEEVNNITIDYEVE